MPAVRSGLRIQGFADLLAARYAVEPDTALAVLLATLAGALGPARKIVNPLGGTLPASLNVMLFADGYPPGLDAVRGATAPLTGLAERYVETGRQKGLPGLRKQRVEVEQRATALLHQLQRLRTGSEAPGLSAVDRATLGEQSEAATNQLFEIEVEERPWLISEGLGLPEIRGLLTHSFDRSLFHYAPPGSAALLAKRSRPEVLAALAAGFRGEPIRLGTEAIPGVAISNLWIVDPGAHRGLQAGDPLWETFLFASLEDTGADLDAARLQETEDDSWWENLITSAFRIRVLQKRRSHTLTAEAREVFINLCNQQRRAPELQGLTRRPEQVLKVALLLHVAGDTANNLDIEVPVLETAAAITARLNAHGIPEAAALLGPPEPVIEVEVQRMVAKLQLHGPMRRRDLFRRYNHQDYAVLEPILRHGLQANLIQTDGEYFTPAN